MTPRDTGTSHHPQGQHAHARGVMPLAAAGTPEDPIMCEALRLIEAFLAIEDQAARGALITLAESLVSYDWVRKVQGRAR
jgi:hypothetical protein